MGWPKKLLLVLIGFALGIIAIFGIAFILIKMSSGLLPEAVAPPPSYVPSPLTPGESLPGRVEAHLYDINVGGAGLNASVDATVTEQLVQSVLTQVTERYQSQGGSSLKVESANVAFTDRGFYTVLNLSASSLQDGEAQSLKGDVGMVVDNIEVLAQGYRAQVELSLGEDLINSFMVWQLPRFQEESELPLQAESVVVSFREGKMAAVVTVKLPVIGDVDLGVRAGVSVTDGRLDIEVDSIDMGRLPLPGEAQDLANAFIASGIAEVESRELPLRLQEITLEDGRMTVRGVVETE